MNLSISALLKRWTTGIKFNFKAVKRSIKVMDFKLIKCKRFNFVVQLLFLDNDKNQGWKLKK